MFRTGSSWVLVFNSLLRMKMRFPILPWYNVMDTIQNVHELKGTNFSYFSWLLCSCGHLVKWTSFAHHKSWNDAMSSVFLKIFLHLLRSCASINQARTLWGFSIRKATQFSFFISWSLLHRRKEKHFFIFFFSDHLIERITRVSETKKAPSKLFLP